MFKVYVPYSDHLKSVACLDDDLLWNQLNDTVLLCQVLVDGTPRSKMLAYHQWSGYEGWLLLYIRRMQIEAQKRGLGSWQDDDRSSPYAEAWLVVSKAGLNQAPRAPRWVGGQWFLESQRSELIRINPEHYAQRFPTTPMEMPFLYPQNTPGHFDYTVTTSLRDLELYNAGERVIPEQFIDYLASKGLHW